MTKITSTADASKALRAMLKQIAPPVGQYPLEGGPHSSGHLAINAVYQFVFAELARRHEEGHFNEAIEQAMAWARDMFDALEAEREDYESATMRALRIADITAEELIRADGDTSSYPEEFSFAPCQIDDLMRDCIEHLCARGLAVQHECEDGSVMVQLLDDLDRSLEGLPT